MGERIAVVLCTRNGSRWIAEQLRSILAQDRVPDSVHITDDASEDDTMAIIEQILEGAPFYVDVVRNETPVGIAANFERTLMRADAEMIALCDQDDRWSPAKLQRTEDVMTEPSVMAVFSDGTLIDESGASVGRSLWQATGVGRFARHRLATGKVLDQLLRWNVVTGATLAVRRAVLDVALPIPRETLHDEWLALIAAGLGDVVAIPERLVEHRLHADAAVGVPPRLSRALARSRREDDDARRYEASRFDEAARRLEAAGRVEAAAAVAAKADFARRRSESTAIGRRVVTVSSGLARGRYHRLAHGLRSAAHDLAFGP